MEQKSQKPAEMENFVSQLKKQDDFNLELGKRMKRFYYILIVIYALLMVVNPFTDFESYQRINGILFVLAFLWFAILFERLQKDFRNVDYGLPTREMMQMVVKRYQLTARNFLVILPPLILVDIALSLSVYHRPETANPWTGVLVVQLVFGLLVIFAVFGGYQFWRNKHKPLVDHAREMLKEMGSE